MRYSKAPPKCPGWYWFRVDDNSPPEMTRLVEAIVHVVTLEDRGRRFVNILDHHQSLAVGFLRGWYRVEDMRGFWAGPIARPESQMKGA